MVDLLLSFFFTTQVNIDKKNKHNNIKQTTKQNNTKMKRLDLQGDPIWEPWEVGIKVLLTVMVAVYLVSIAIQMIRNDALLTSVKTQLEKMEQRYDDLVYENEILWTYVENVDTYKSLEDAIQKRDDIYDLIQFIGE